MERDSWLVVWTQPRAEKKVAERLREAGVEPWLPTIVERRRWSDRWRDVVFPLFPGYLFARAATAEVPAILRTAGVLTMVKEGGKPARLTDAFVTSLKRALLAPGLQASRLEDPIDYEVDDEVIVQDGPLVGFRGVVREIRGARQLVVWVAAIRHGVAFTIDASLVAPRNAFGGPTLQRTGGTAAAGLVG